MPFKSKAQRRKFRAMESRGEISKGTSDRWESHTKKRNLPERKSHGMQMGTSGYGITHGMYGSSSYVRGDTGGSYGDM